MGGRAGTEEPEKRLGSRPTALRLNCYRNIEALVLNSALASK